MDPKIPVIVLPATICDNLKHQKRCSDVLFFLECDATQWDIQVSSLGVWHLLTLSLGIVFLFTATTTHVIQKSTYQNNKNPNWDLDLSSVTAANPMREALTGTTNNFASFRVGDQKPTFTLTFKGNGATLLHHIEGLLTTKYRKTTVAIRAFNGNRLVSTKVRLQCNLTWRPPWY